MKTKALCIFILLLFACTAGAGQESELYRIRVRNSPGGLVQVSLDQGRTYACVGRVKAPATTRATGFLASCYSPAGTVAATAIHGIRIKTGQLRQGVIGREQMPQMISLTPAEFSRIPKGYGGHIPGSSGILTDIPAGRSIFRNFSPYAGSRVYLEADSRLSPLPEDYTPRVGDTIVIPVTRPENSPVSVEFENRAGGSVSALYGDGRQETLASVERPVLGVGRYDGTTFTGVGAINTNHGGVLTVSTAPVRPPGTVEGGSLETRGGFMIQPYYHVMDQGEKAVQVMVIARGDRSRPVLEGTPPLFGGHINLWHYPGHPEASYRVQVKIDEGEWEPVPEITGRVDDAFTAAGLQRYFAKSGRNRKVKSGVTAVRLLFPVPDSKLLASELSRECEACVNRAIAAGIRPVKGELTLRPKRPMEGIVTYAVDGRTVQATSVPPHTFAWDTTSLPNGFHTVDVIDHEGNLAESRQILVRN